MAAVSANRRLSWLIGAATLAAVIGIALHLSEEREFASLVRHADLRWLALAVGLQALTYFAQGEVFRLVPAATGVRLPRRWLYALSLSKLFLDQAIPSAGVSSTLVIANAMERRGLRRPTVSACAMINLASYHSAYVVMMSVALGIAASHGQAPMLVLVSSAAFMAFAVGLTSAVLGLSGRPSGFTTRLAAVPFVGSLATLIRDADRRLVDNAPLLTRASLWQTAIFAIDATTLWSITRGLGDTTSAAAIFACFMVASVFRTIGIMPGGLGTYEAVSVVTLNLSGLSIPAALSSTLIFRGLSFWLPMVPGLWCSRRLTADDGGGTPVERDDYWTRPAVEVLASLGTGPAGLSTAEAAARLQQYGPNLVRPRVVSSRARLLLAQLTNPLLLILLFAAAAAIASGETVDATIVLVIIVASVGISYSREASAQAAIDALQAKLRIQATVIRDERRVMVPAETVVPGDIVLLSAGSLVPADMLLLEAGDCFVSEAALTGESFPVQKSAGDPAFLGTNVRSGSGRGVVVRTGAATSFGAIASRLSLQPPITDFERGLRRFGYLLTVTMLALVAVLFAAHLLRGRAPIETLLFAVALAVGLSPELLPAILSVNLARGAQALARRGVMVRRINAIENLGSMDVLCTDKTGTLTEGSVELAGAYDADGTPSPDVLRLGVLNAALQTGLPNPLDEALAHAGQPDPLLRKRAEIPFDYSRRRVSVIVDTADGAQIITKGAFAAVTAVCALDDATAAGLRARYEAWTRDGIRVLAVAVKPIARRPAYGRDDEAALTFAGFLTFLDQPKTDAAAALVALARLGVAVKLVTGDSRLVAQHVARMVGLDAERIVAGAELARVDDATLARTAAATSLFVEVDPHQKERIVLALRAAGRVVGFLGDGVNDAPAMHAADTSLSVERAVDVARQAADFVLLESDLDVIRRGIQEGRRTFANTIKYILITTSANLGNMLSMAVASLFLPFLPLTAGQILLNNVVSDIPAVGLADDAVDDEMVERPERWSMRLIGTFMVTFGVLSSAFDGLIFALLLGVFHAAEAVFRTGWFVESLLTELVVAPLVRTRRPFFRSRPGTLLLWSTMVLIGATLAVPYVGVLRAVGFVPLPAAITATIVAVTLLYAAATELLKRRFFAWR